MLLTYSLSVWLENNRFDFYPLIFIWNTKNKEVLNEFSKIKLDILVTTETKKKGNGTEEIATFI